MGDAVGWKFRSTRAQATGACARAYAPGFCVCPLRLPSAFAVRVCPLLSTKLAHRSSRRNNRAEAVPKRSMHAMHRMLNPSHPQRCPAFAFEKVPRMNSLTPMAPRIFKGSPRPGPPPRPSGYTGLTPRPPPLHTHGGHGVPHASQTEPPPQSGERRWGERRYEGGGGGSLSSRYAYKHPDVKHALPLLLPGRGGASMNHQAASASASGSLSAR